MFLSGQSTAYKKTTIHRLR